MRRRSQHGRSVSRAGLKLSWLPAAGPSGNTAAPAAAPVPAAADAAAEMCPVCHEALGAELAMLPCGHQLCVNCHMAMVERVPGAMPEARVRACTLPCTLQPLS